MPFSALDARMDAQHDVLVRIEDHLARLNGRVGSAEKWQAGGDAMLDSLNERVSENTDRFEKHEERITKQVDEHQSWIDRQTGGMSARTQMIVMIGILLSAVGTLVTVVSKIH